MGYFNFYIIKKFINSFFRYLRKNMKFIIFYIIFAFILIIQKNCFGYTDTVDIYNEIQQRQIQNQNQFIFECMFPYFENTEAWTNTLKPIFDDIHNNQYDVYISYTKTNTTIQYRVALHHINSGTTGNTQTEYSSVGGTYTVNGYTNSSAHRYIVNFYPATNTFSSTYESVTVTIPYAAAEIKSPLFIEFFNMVYGNTTQQSFFNSIENYLDSIDDVTTDILSELNTLSGVLSTISNNTATNYSQQISQISGKIDDILTDNDTIISQNSSMIEQQEQINDNLENINDTLTDDTVESSASDLPSTNVNNPTENGIDNIFTSIYNAFCVGEAQDIVFPIPFTNKNITLSPYYVRDMLNNNNAGWIYTLIQAFWGYLIGRYIVSDISKKIDKIKSGNIENVENTNIKEEML